MGNQLPYAPNWFGRAGRRWHCHNVGPSGVATGRGAFHFRSSSSWGLKKTPTDEIFTL
ncbi:hypothetical protein [Rummeliibacillus sp. SL167]|uniref:hypothetical protein n=1 Tax=Rummeliibacillus sp. SL167 TaxID=2579792 RepID=UPI00164483A7|nr:hypothetical protein [Rummeliibacillus sp. SL167]